MICIFEHFIIPDKTKLEHELHNQTHDDWYYKMYFDMLNSYLTLIIGFRFILT